MRGDDDRGLWVLGDKLKEVFLEFVTAIWIKSVESLVDADDVGMRGKGGGKIGLSSHAF